MKKFLIGAVAAAFVFAFATSASAAYMHSTTLKFGQRSAQVMSLQTTLGVTPATGYFGNLTKAAVMTFQASNGLTADGVVGPMTGAKIATIGSTVVVPPVGQLCPNGNPLANNCMPVSGSTGSTSGSLSGGETSIDDVNVDDADDDTLNEGVSKTPVANINFNVDDADAQLVRADIVFQASDANTDEDRPWRVFDEVYLMDGSTVVASMDASDEDAWDDADDLAGTDFNSGTNDAYRIRFNNVNKTYKEDADAELWVAVDVKDNVDGADAGADWGVGIEDDGLRFIDGAGLDTFESSSDVATFSVEEAGADSEFSVTEATDSPDASSLEVKTNTSTTSTIAIFNVDTDEDGGDVKLNDFPVTLTSSTTLNLSVQDVYVVIDGKTYTADESVTGSANFQTFHFDDIDDADVMIDAGDDMDVTVKVKFKSQQSGNSANGTTIYAAAAVASSDVEDADSGDDIGDVNGTATADTFTLFSDGLSVQLTGGEAPSKSVNQSAQTIKLTYDLTFKVTAFGDDVYIPKTVAEISGSSAGLLYEIENSSGAQYTAGNTSAGSLQSSADEINGYYRVDEGETETFTVQISATGGAAGFYHVQLNAVQFDTDTSGALTSYTLSPENDFDTTDGQIDA